MEAIDKYTLVENFLAKKLSNEEQIEFTKQLEIDSELKEIYTIYVNMSKSIKIKDKIDIKQKIKSAEISYLKNKEKIIEFKGYLINRQSLLSWAAVMLILISSGAFILFRSNTLSNEQLFQNYYAKYEQIIELRSQESKSPIQLGLIEYKSGHYNKAIQLLNSSEINRDNPLTNFYKGLCFIELQDFNGAITSFTLALNKNSDYNQEVEWYLALSFLGSEQKESAKEILVKISNDQYHYYNKKAKNILKKF